MAERDHRRLMLPAVGWQSVVDALDDGVMVLEREGRIRACNQAAERILARSSDQLVGFTPLDLRLGAVREDGSPLTPEDYPSTTALRTQAPVRGQVMGVRDGEGRRRWLSVAATPVRESSGREAVVVTFADVTERRDYEAKLRRLAEIDELTGLPNRRGFVGELTEHLASRRREDTRGALLLLDLDHFKQLNDSLGHVIGDRLLVHAARAMKERLRATDLLGRLGGDEFAVLLRRADREQAELVAAALSARLHEEVVPAPGGGTRQISASIGIVPLDGAAGASAERALQYADDAMYAAKSEGRDGWQVFGAESADHDERRAQVDLQLAKRTRQLALANALGARLAGMTNLEDIAEATVEELHRAFGYHLCAVIRVREDERVEALAVRGAPFTDLRLREWSQPVDEGLIGRCLRERRPLLINDVREEPDYQATPETADVRSELVVPLLVEGSLWGVLNLEELVEDAFHKDDAQLLSILANQVAAAIRSVTLLQRLRRVESLAS